MHNTIQLDYAQTMHTDAEYEDTEIIPNFFETDDVSYWFHLEFETLPQSFYFLERQPDKVFIGTVIRLIPREQCGAMIQYGAAIMKIVDEDLETIEGEVPQISEIQSQCKMFQFIPVLNSSQARHYKLHFTINFLLENGEQKTEIIVSDEFQTEA